ncbi:hypothetical protein LCGC14_1373950 [marine sediment metagenome]|uniref:Uncharacterized protein n=1 Tax=marine sediment metagenome TaxID=412755 RepID=A0A0F9MJS5_9ZZZZ
MPVLKCLNGKWKIGSGKCIYPTKAKAERAFRGFLGAKHAKKKGK